MARTKCILKTIGNHWTGYQDDAMLTDVADERRTALGPVGELLMANIKRVREGQRLTYVELAERLTTIGRPIPVLGLRRIERGERRVDVDDLLAISYALGVPVVDLLVPSDLPRDAPYNLTPALATTADAAINWVRGDPRTEGTAVDGDTDAFGMPPAPWPIELLGFTRWMAEPRKGQVLVGLIEWHRRRSTEGEVQEDGRPNQEDHT